MRFYMVAINDLLDLCERQVYSIVEKLVLKVDIKAFWYKNDLMHWKMNSVNTAPDPFLFNIYIIYQ